MPFERFVGDSSLRLRGRRGGHCVAHSFEYCKFSGIDWQQMPRLCRSADQRLPRDGDILAINRGSPEVQISDVEFEKRRAAWQPRVSASRYQYAQPVGIAAPRRRQANPGAAEKTVLCGYLDIFSLLPHLRLGSG